MSFNNQFSYEQTLVLRAAFDMALVEARNLSNEARRLVIASTVLALISEEGNRDAPMLARLVVEKLNRRPIKTAPSNRTVELGPLPAVLTSLLLFHPSRSLRS